MALTLRILLALDLLLLLSLAIRTSPGVAYTTPTAFVDFYKVLTLRHYPSGPGLGTGNYRRPLRQTFLKLFKVISLLTLVVLI